MWRRARGRSVNGQQFIIEDCEDCDLYVFDDNAAVTIDECKNCRIFIGPCDSSIFIRDCYNCKLVFFCRQFRCVCGGARGFGAAGLLSARGWHHGAAKGDSIPSPPPVLRTQLSRANDGGRERGRLL